jgi:hypothetical protein
MNMRKRKLAIMTAMYYIAANAMWDRWINSVLKPSPEEVAKHKAEHEKFWLEIKDRLHHVNIPNPDTVWKVARVKDNVVVLEASTLREAREAIDKAARQKKAKLYLLSDEPYQYPLGKSEEPLVEYDAKNFVHMV